VLFQLICHMSRDAHSAPLLLYLRLSSLSSRREVHIPNIVDSIIAKRVHPALYEMFKVNGSGNISNNYKGRTSLGITPLQD